MLFIQKELGLHVKTVMADEDKLKGIDLSGQLDYTPRDKQNFKERMMSVSLSNASAREWFSKTRESVKPWTDFLNSKKFKVPKSVSPVPKRIVKNVEHFQGNYLFVFMGLVVVCLVTSPILLVAIAALLGACYIISVKNQDKKIVLMGRELSLVQQYAVVGACSFPLFWLAGACSAVFWVIGASFFAIMLHASMYMTPEELEGYDIQLDEVSATAT